MPHVDVHVHIAVRGDSFNLQLPRDKHPLTQVSTSRPAGHTIALWLTADRSQTVLYILLCMYYNMSMYNNLCTCTCALYMHVVYMPELERDSDHLCGEFLIDNGIWY